MARPREELSAILHGILGTGNVYFQPPESMEMEYPCIIYERTRIGKDKANNHTYRITKQYTVTTIDEDPDTELPDKINELPYTRHDRRFVSDGLYHDVFTLYF